MVQSQRSKGFAALQVALLLLLCAVTIFPFLMMLSTSLKAMNEIRSPHMTLLPHEWSFASYVDILTSAKWGRYFLNSFYVTAWSVGGALLINTMAGFAFARLRFPGRDVLFALALLGMMIPTQVTMLPAYVIMRYVPFAGGNNWLGQGGAGLLDSYAGLIVANLCGSYGVFLYRQFLMSFPDALDDAAKIDGLTCFGRYLRIYLPLSKTVLATLVVVRATSTWNDYLWPLLMTQKERMYTVQLALSQQFTSDAGDRWNMIMAGTALIILPVVILFLSLQRYFVAGIVTTGVKG